MLKQLICWCLLCSLVYAKDFNITIYNNAEPKILTSEVEQALVFLDERIRPENRPYIRFFTTYAVPEEYRNKCALTLSFVCHSLAGLGEELGGYYPIAYQLDDHFSDLKKVPGSDTLWWIDLREYNWTEEAWEKIASVDGYFVEPAVDHKTMGQFRLQVGNGMLRADWFIVHATDVMRQKDTGEDFSIYKTLLYANVEEPKTIGDFKKIWGLDDTKADKLGNGYGSLVLTSNKVALHNRILWGYRTELGWLYETFDVKDQTGKGDYLENFPRYGGKKPDFSDAGEVFASNHLHMQVYDLRDGEDNLVDFADPGVARHITDVLSDVRVKTAYSCMDCHAAGPLPAENIIADYSKFLSPKFEEKGDQLNVGRAYLDNRFKESVEQNQELFAIALKKINGLTPEENVRNYLEIIRWYNQPIFVEQAAKELGMEPEKYVDKFNDTHEVDYVGKIPGRIKLMLHDTQPIGIPRNTWESKGKDGIPGMFQQSIIYVYGLTTIKEIEAPIQIKQNLILDKSYDYETSEDGVGVYIGSEQVGMIAKKGTQLELLSYELYSDVWIAIKVNNKKCYINKNFVKIK